MPIEHPNLTLIRRLFAAFAAQDGKIIRSIVSEDAVWYFPGKRGALAGEYHGHEEILHFVASVPRLTNNTHYIQLHDMTVIFTGHAERKGKTLNNRTALVIRVANGKATEFRQFVWDLPSVEDFWA
jgi:ketosteroid isomerase-like protein